MKLKSGFILHTVGEERVVVPVGERTKTFHGMIRLNGTGAFLWENMQEDFTEESLVAALLDRYEVTEDVASETVARFVKTLADGDILEN